MSSAPVGITRIEAQSPSRFGDQSDNPDDGQMYAGAANRDWELTARRCRRCERPVVTPAPRNPDRVNSPSVISYTETLAATRTP